MQCGEKKVNLGCGRLKLPEYIGIDVMQIVDGNGDKMVDIVRDVEKQGLPFCDNSVIEIKADNVLEHLDDLIGVMNECWRVLGPDGFIEGIVPMVGTNGSFRDPTHRRFFNEDTFCYFYGVSEAYGDKHPKHPKYAQYGILPWDKIEVSRPKDNGHIYFKMKPRKK